MYLCRRITPLCLLWLFLLGLFLLPRVQAQAPTPVPLYRVDGALGGDLDARLFLTGDPGLYGTLLTLQHGPWAASPASPEGYVYAQQAPGTVPLYEFFAPAPYSFFFTTNEAEAELLEDTASGYIYQGVTCYVLPDAAHGGVPLERTYDAATGQHSFTTAPGQEAGDGSGWADEGPACWVLAASRIAVGDHGFEDAPVGAGASQVAPPGSAWSYAGTAGVSGDGSALTGPAGGAQDAPQGAQAGFVQGTGALSQSLPGFLGGVSYTLDVLAAAQAGVASGQSVGVSLDGQGVGTVTPSGAPPAPQGYSLSSYALYSYSLGVVGAGSHTLSFTGLDPSGGDNTAFLDDVHVYGRIPPPDAPSGLSATLGSGGTALSWTASPTTGAAYDIYRAASGGAYTLLTSGASGTGYTDTSANGTAYSYEVTAIGPGGESAPSNEAEAASAAPLTAAAVEYYIYYGSPNPFPVNTFTAAAPRVYDYTVGDTTSGYGLSGGGTVCVLYDFGTSVSVGAIRAQFTGAGTDYAYFSADGSGNSWTPLATPVSGSQQTFTPVTTRYVQFVLAGDEPYVTDARVYDGSGAPVSGPLPPPDAPTGLTYSQADTNNITLTWNAVSGATGYNLYKLSTYADENEHYNYYKANSAPLTAPAYVDNDFALGQLQSYQVTAVGPGGESARSSTLSVMPLGRPSLQGAVVTMISQGSQTTEMMLNWSAVPGATGYNVYRSSTSGSDYYEIGTTTTGTASATSYNDSYLGPPGSDTYYVVAATYGFNVGHEVGPYSNQVAASGIQASGPVITAAASAVQVSPTTARLTVAASDGAGGSLTYTWATSSGGVTYSDNGTTTASDVIATFSHAGTYTFTVTVSAADGTVTGTATLTLTIYPVVTVTPAGVSVAPGGTVPFTATETDQFGASVGSQPTFAWSVLTNGGGSITPGGVYTAPPTEGQATVQATAGSLSGTAAVTITSWGALPNGDIPPPDWAPDAVPEDSAGSDGAGPASSEGVSLPAGAKVNTPGPDLGAFNPVGPSVSFERTYRSTLASAGYASPGLSPGWVHNYDLQVRANADGSYTLRYPTGGLETWRTNASGQLSPPNGAPYLVSLGSTGPVMTFPDRSRYIFYQPAGSQVYRLGIITNVVGRSVTLSYDPMGRLTSLVNDASPAVTLLKLSYGNTGGLLSAVQDNTGRQVAYGVGPAKNGSPSGTYLTSVSTVFDANIAGTTLWQYDYENVGGAPLLWSVQTPNPTGAGGMSTATTDYNSTTGRVQSLTDADNNQHAYTYNSGSAQLKFNNIAPAESVSVTQDFDPAQQNVDTGDVDANNKATKIGHTGSPSPYLPTSFTNRNNQTTSATYDPTNNFGNVKSTTDARGTTTTYQYQFPSDFALGQVQAVSVVNKDPQTGAQSYLGTTYINYNGPNDTYNGPNDARPNGLVKSVQTCLPNNTTTPNAIGVTTTYQYDALGNVTQVTTPSATGTRTVTYNYTTGYSGYNNYSQAEALGEPVAVTVSSDSDNSSVTTYYEYDALGRRTAATDALGQRTTYQYNDADQVTQVTAPPVQYRSGSNGPIINSQKSFVTQYTYQYVGGPLTMVTLLDENGNPVRHITYGYGPEGELLGVGGDTTPVFYDYDGLYRTLHVSTDGTHKTVYAYDDVGNLASVTYPGSDSVAYPQYDDDGHVKKRIDGNGVETDYQYDDPESLLTGIQYPGVSGLNVTFTYDGFGRRTEMTDGTGSKSYFYDLLGNPLSVTTNFNAGGPPSQTLNYVYNPDGSRQSLTFPLHFYSSASNEGATGGISYGYDGVGRLTHTLYNWGHGTHGYSYAYQANGLLSTTRAFYETSGDLEYPFAETDYQYDARGLLTDLTNSEIRAYDPNSSAASQLSLVSDFKVQGPSNGQHLTTYDASGDRLGEAANVPGWDFYGFPGLVGESGGATPPDKGYAPSGSRAVTYSYTNRAELSSEVSVVTSTSSASAIYNANYSLSFLYDAAGNPTTFRNTAVSGAYNPDNQAPYPGYDRVGDPTSLPSYSSLPLYFDPEQRLAAIGTVTDRALAATSDGDGLRATATGPGPTATGKLTTFFVYDGDSPLLELAPDGSLLAADAWGADGLRGRFYPGPSQAFPDPTDPDGTPDPDLNLAAPELYSYLYDPQGSVSARQAVHLDAADPNDTQSSPRHLEYELLDLRAYDAFGQMRGMAYGSTLGSDAAGRAATAAWGREVLAGPDWAFSEDPVGFGGQWGYRYGGGGLSLLGHRYYDATTGRFLTRDPLGYKGGINLYGFVGNNPVTQRDPNGLDPLNSAQSNQVVQAIRMIKDSGYADSDGHTGASITKELSTLLNSGRIQVDNTPTVPGGEMAYVNTNPFTTRGNVVIHLHSDLFDSSYPGKPFDKFVDDVKFSAVLLHEHRHALVQGDFWQGYHPKAKEDDAYHQEELYLKCIQSNNWGIRRENGHILTDAKHNIIDGLIDQLIIPESER